MRDKISVALAKLVLPICATALVCMNARAQNIIDPDPKYYDFHPMSIMSLGVGFSPNDVSDAKLNCVDLTPKPMEPGALGTTFTTLLVTDSNQLKEALSLDAKVDASYLTFKGGSTFNYTYNGLFNEHSATLVVSARTEFGRIGTKGTPTLTDAAQKLLSDGAKFERDCGSRLVVVERRGASVSAIINISGISSEVTQQLSTSMATSGGWGPLSASASALIQGEMRKATKSGRASVQVVATGGTGFGELGKLVAALTAEENSFDKVQSALGDFMKQFTVENSAPIGFHVLSMEKLGWKADQTDIWTVQKERHLRELTETFRSLALKRDIAARIAAGTDVRNSVLKSIQVEAIRNLIPSFDRYLDAIAETQKDCKDNQAASLSICELPSLPIPQSDLIPEIPSAPEAAFYVVADGEFLDIGASKAIIYNGGQSLLERAKAVRPSSTRAQVVFRVVGKYLAAANLIFRDKDSNITSIKGLELPDEGTAFIFEDSAQAAPLAQLIDEFMRQTKKEGTGVFQLATRTKFGAEYTFDLLEASWRVLGANVYTNTQLAKY